MYVAKDFEMQVWEGRSFSELVDSENRMSDLEIWSVLDTGDQATNKFDETIVVESKVTAAGYRYKMKNRIAWNVVWDCLSMLPELNLNIMDSYAGNTFRPSGCKGSLKQKNINLEDFEYKFFSIADLDLFVDKRNPLVLAPLDPTNSVNDLNIFVPHSNHETQATLFAVKCAIETV
ncbi:hypothetical protein O9G_003764 [Rozella allomycis CSF55]|uniref:Uncharacterized protein n=1 Tax=Rozella allomycis (strain CSF55) TaxID=988480 RepID=A0A075AZN4_ROZAC|nr:hypothetical protein O9G_003764 [Rozella allomycis CSF55]|eukprot:EPZ34044.1 hypothetical protein O9G_003764 [Rozella allomycis CSF55]